MPSLKIKRIHGLGDILMLLPVLKAITDQNIEVFLYTRKEFLPIFKYIDFAHLINFKEWAGEDINIDLDKETLTAIPSMHRTDEFYKLCQIEPRHDFVPLNVLKNNIEKRDKKVLVVGPEAEHPSRLWNLEKTKIVCRNWLENNGELIVVGNKKENELPCTQDLRGKTSLDELLYHLNLADLVLSLDSGVLHIAGALQKPTVAIFGNINPWYRIKYHKHTIALTGNINCFPCNKKEKCPPDQQFACINQIKPGHVIQAIKLLTVDNYYQKQPLALSCFGENSLKEINLK